MVQRLVSEHITRRVGFPELAADDGQESGSCSTARLEQMVEGGEERRFLRRLGPWSLGHGGRIRTPSSPRILFRVCTEARRSSTRSGSASYGQSGSESRRFGVSPSDSALR